MFHWTGVRPSDRAMLRTAGGVLRGARESTGWELPRVSSRTELQPGELLADAFG